MNLGKFDCATGIINILYNDTIKNISVRTSTIKDMPLIDKLQKEKRFSSTLKIMLLAFALAFLGP